jgi:hypothetical protein
VAVKVQWCQLYEMETEKRRRWGATVFSREEGRRRGDSTVPEADNTTKSATTAGEAEGDSWRLEVEDDQRKLS